MFKIKAPDGRNNISGKKVKQYRLAKKMSQYKLAAKIQAMGYDVDNHFIRRIETANGLSRILSWSFYPKRSAYPSMIF